MAYAAQCFQQPETLVKEVAFKLGFSDPFHFTRAFKKVFGICPQAFKQLR
jgi:AraC-like DNA-binding protein